MLRRPSIRTIGGVLLAVGVSIAAYGLASPGLILATGAQGYNGGGTGGVGSPGTGIGGLLWLGVLLVVAGLFLMLAARLSGNRRR